MPPAPPPLPPYQSPSSSTSAARGVAMVAIWIMWIGVTLVADLLGFLMFAFADSPGAGKAAQMMIAPAFCWFAFTFVAGAVLLVLRRPWQIVLAFVLAASPPFVIFAGYNLLDGASSASVNTAPGPSTAPAIQIPSEGFAPKFTPREQPDFRKSFPVFPTTRPAATQP